MRLHHTAIVLFSILASPAQASELWFEGDWVAVVQGAFCTVIRFEAEGSDNLAEIGAAKPTLPCKVKDWHPTTFTVDGNKVTVAPSGLTDRMSLTLDRDGDAVIMADGATRMKRVQAPDLGGVNPTDSSRYELPGRISVSLAGGWSLEGGGNFGPMFKHSERGSVYFFPVPLAELGGQMMLVGKTMGRLHEFSKMDTDQKLGDIQARVFESETKRLTDGFAGARIITIEACCGEALVVYASANGPNPNTMWQNVDQMLGSMRDSDLAVNPGCAAPGDSMKAAMTTLTSSTWGEALRKQLVVGASALKSELRRLSASRVGPEGPSDSGRKWAECATNALAAVDDVAKGVWQMNKGNYAHEWVQTGRFGTDQERMLDRIGAPGAHCEEWVKALFRADTFAPISSYLTARDKMDALNCPTNPAPKATTGD